MARAGLGELVALPVRQRLRRQESVDLRSQLGRRRHQARRRRKPDVGGLAPATSSTSHGPPFPARTFRSPASYRGLGRERDNAPTRSGTFWPFWNLIRGLALADRAPRTIVLENVYGCLTSHGGKDFAAIASALADSGYKFGAAVIDASHFVPQSRPRVFFIAVRKGRGNPRLAYRAWASARMASSRADQRLCRHDPQGEKELGLVGYRNACSADIDVFGSR